MNDIVYKYRVWENGSHKNLLLYNELYLASPKDFNDPFDCRIPANYLEMTNEERNNYITEFARSHEKTNDTEGLNSFKGRISKPKEFQSYYENLLFKEQDKFYGILSLSLRWNSILMWSHYSDCHRGFCVGFYKDKLWDTGFFGKAREVEYDIKFPHIKPKATKTTTDIIEQTFIQTHTKSEDWTQEEEFRFVQNFFPNEPKPFERIINIPDNVFAEVILGINISDNDRDEITEICKRKGIPVYMAKKKDFLFEIDRDRII